jgi:hypothetical protein
VVDDRGEFHESDPVGMIEHHPARDFQCEPGLSGAARSGQCDEAAVAEQGDDLTDLVIPADERGELGRQCVARALERSQLRELPVEIRVADLEDALGLDEIAESVHTEVEEVHVVGEVVAEEFTGRSRDQDLSTVPGAREPRKPVDR